MNYLLQRISQAVLTLFAAVTISFTLIRLMPGGPAEFIRSRIREMAREGLEPDEQISEEQLNQMTEAYIGFALGPDQPLHEEYLSYLFSVLQGDLGQSIILQRGTPVLEIYAGAIPWTMLYASIGIFYGFAIGVLLGSLMAYFERSRFDVGMTISMILNGAIPYYVAAIFLLYMFGFQWDVFPTSGRMDSQTTPGYNLPFIYGVLHHATLPAASILVTGFGGGALGMRANSIRILGSDYLRVARLRGLSSFRISTRYLGRNAVLPLYTSFLIALGFIIGGSIILEEIFSYPGVGWWMYNATIARDYPVLMGGFLIMILMFVFAMLLADLTYSKIDPRASQTESR